jgi:DNA-binding IclR family transcriptional regulator
MLRGLEVENGEARRSVKSAERVFDLLEIIGREPHGVAFTWLARSLGIPKSSLHSLLEVLLKRGYIEYDGESRRYSLGVRVWETGQAYQRHHNLLAVASRVLEGIVDKVNETAQLAKLSGRENVYLAKVDSTHPLRLQSEVGLRLSAHATGVGKALLAQLPDDEVVARFGWGKLPVMTPTTHATTQSLLAELAITRERGFAIDNSEYTQGVFCLAVPVFDNGSKRAATALSVSLPLLRATVSQLAVILSLVARSSAEIAAGCGVNATDPSLIALTDLGNARRAITEIATSGRYDLDLSA